MTNELRCWKCGNEPTETVDLEWDEENRLMHIDDDCPPMVTGWAACSMCQRAHPLTDLFVAEVHAKIVDGEIAETGDLHPPNTRTPPRWVHTPTMPDYPDDLPLGTKGVVAERDGNGVMFVACKEHTRFWAPEATKRLASKAAKASTSAGAANEAAADDLLAKVPTDGPGLGIQDLMKVWKLSERKTRELVGQYVADGLLTFDEKATATGGAKAKLYRRAAE